MKKPVYKILIVLTTTVSSTLFFALFAFSYWTTTTESGLHWLLSLAQQHTKGELIIENPTGNLVDSINFSRLQYRDTSVELLATNLNTRLNLPALLAKTIQLTEIKADEVSLTLVKPGNDDKQTEPLQLDLPFTLQLNDGSINALHIRATPSSPQLFTNIHWQALQLKTRLSLQKLHVENEFGTITTSGSMNLNAPQKINLDSSWQLNAIKEFAQSQGNAKITGSINSPRIQIETKLPFKSTLTADIENLLTSPNWRADFTSPEITLNTLYRPLDTNLTGLHVKSTGNLTAFNIIANGTLRDNTWGGWAFKLDADTTPNDVVINALTLNANQGQAQVNASAKLLSPLTSITQDTGFTLNAHWNALQWPLLGDAKLQTRQGQLGAQGTLDAYSTSIKGDLLTGGQLFEQLDIIATGNLQQLSVSQLNGQYINGTWQGNGTVSWHDGIKWQANLTTQNADLSVINNRYPSQLNSRINTAGKYSDEGLETHHKFTALKGIFLGYPLQGKGDVNYTNNRLQLHGVELKSKDAALTASLSIDELTDKADNQINASWTLAAKNLAQWIPNAKGEMRSQGSIKGLLQSPIINASVTANNINYDEKYRIAALKANINTDLTGKEHSRIDISAEKLQWGESSLDSVNVKGDGKPQQHQLTMAVIGAKGQQFSTSATGQWNQQQWRLLLNEGKVNNTQLGQWQQEKPSTLQISDKQLALTDYCFSSEASAISVSTTRAKNTANATHQQNIANEHACIAIKSDFQQWNGSLAINGLLLSRTAPLLPPQIIKLTGTLAGTSQVSYSPNQPLVVNALWHSDGGEVEYNVENDVTQKSPFSNLSAKLSSDGKKLKLAGNLRIDDAGTVAFNATMPEALALQSPLLQQPVSANVNVNLSNLDIISIFLPEVRATQGSWNSDILFEGTLSAPVLIGNSRLVANNVSLPRWGVHFDTIETNTQSTKDLPLRIEGRATSKSGFITFRGEAMNPNGKTLFSKLNIDGKDFTAVNLPEARIDISPKLQIITENENIQLEGELLIDKADIQILASQPTITPSTDVIIIDETTEKPVSPAIALSANVRIKLGDKVRLHGYGFDGKLKGELVIVEKPNDLTRATGELQIIDGKYEAFGQELIITKGKLLYASATVDNPNVAIRAIRKTSNNVVAGVIVSGEAQSPKIDLFSDPAMDDADILAYIVLGYPIKQASADDGSVLSRAAGSLGLAGGEKLAKEIAENFGIDEVRIESSNTTQEASLVLGKYLSPKLYVQYAIGIGQTVNAMQLQYQLSDKWLIKGESSETQGADILYTIEK